MPRHWAVRILNAQYCLCSLAITGYQGSMTVSAHSLYPNKRAQWAQVPKGWGMWGRAESGRLIYRAILSKVTPALMQSASWQPERKKKKSLKTNTFLHQALIAFIQVQVQKAADTSVFHRCSGQTPAARLLAMRQHHYSTALYTMYRFMINTVLLTGCVL